MPIRVRFYRSWGASGLAEKTV